MISIIDTMTLARTKLRTRKIRTGLTVGVSGILFGLLVAASLIVSGISSSVDLFSKQGLGARYIAQASVPPADSQGMDYTTQPDIISRAEQIQKERIKNKQADAKKLGLEYDQKSEPSVTIVDAGTKYLQMDAPASKQAVEEYQKEHSPTKTDRQIIDETLKPYTILHEYESTQLQVGSGSWKSMKNGKEDLTGTKQSQTNSSPYTEQSDPLVNGAVIMDGSLTESFLTKKQQWKPEHNTIPVIITYAQAEKYLGLKTVPSSASAQQRLDRIQQIRDTISGFMIQTCYRNSASMQALQTAQQQIKEIKANAGNKDYEMPLRQWALPDPATCGAPSVSKDTRTAAQKKTDENQAILAKKYDGVVDPVQQKFTFEVVGLSPGVSQQGGGLLDGIVQGIFNPTLGTGWIIPRDKYNQVATRVPVEQILTTQESSTNFAQYMSRTYVEFASYKDALAAIKKYSCLFGCDSSQRLYLITFGSGSIALEQIKESLYEFLKYVLIVIVAIAGIIMMGTIGRTIADSRRETAVFRAIGAKRRDISAVYFVYSLLLALRVFIFSLVLGVVIAVGIDIAFSANTSANAQLLFGTSDLAQRFHYVGVNSIELVAIAGIIALCSVASATVPLLRGVRRSPISDMRDDT